MAGHVLNGGALLEWGITHHRWFFCLFFLLPLSAAFELYLKAKYCWVYWTREKAPAKHKERVAEVQKQVS
jgi:hypothetical protein